jgi:hypothetical protein
MQLEKTVEPLAAGRHTEPGRTILLPHELAEGSASLALRHWYLHISILPSKRSKNQRS